MASQRMDAANYTTSGRNSTGKSSAKKKPNKGKVISAAAKSAPKGAKGPVVSALAKLMPKTMNVLGSARPTKAASKAVSAATGRDRFGPASKSDVKSIPKTGRDRWGASPRPDKTKFMERQADEAKIMSNMYRNRLGPGQH